MMKSFTYADSKIDEKEIMIVVPSMLIGGGILSFPSVLAGETNGSDGWVAIVIGGLFALLVAWLVAKLATSFPNESFIAYTSAIITRPLAILLTLLFGTISLLTAAYVIRNIANAAKEYLFEQTPIEVVALTFLLVVVYAVSSSRIGLFRLNMLFFPFVFMIIIVIILLNFKNIDFGDLLPVFRTPFTGYIKGTGGILTSYVGIGILLFYLTLADHPKNAPKMVSLGVCIVIFLYILIFIACIGVFGHITTANLLNPTVELAKQTEIPGGIFERVEVIFYVIWIMTIFNTAAMAFDIAVLALESVFKKAQKIKLILMLSPLVYVISMLPQNYTQLNQFGTMISYASAASTASVTVLLLIIAKIRGVRQVG